MNKIMFDISWNRDSGLQRRRACALLLTAGLLLFLGGPFAAQRCVAQSMDDTGDQSIGQQTYQSLDQQTEQMSEQDLGLTPDQDTGLGPDQQTSQQWYQPTDQMQYDQSGQIQNQQPGQMQNQQPGWLQNPQPGQIQNQQPGWLQNQQPGQMQNLPTVSAEQLISIVEQQPLILKRIKFLIVQRSGEQLATISDEMVYERIRQDASLREVITRLLIWSGFGPDLEAINENSPKTENARPPNIATQQIPNLSPRQPEPYQNPDNPQVQQRLSPYRNMPSLSDLYSQFPATRPKLRRFGSDAFHIGNESSQNANKAFQNGNGAFQNGNGAIQNGNGDIQNGSGAIQNGNEANQNGNEAFRVGNENANGRWNPDQLPMDLPAGPDYVVGPGDSLIVNMWGGRSSRISRVIDRQGQIDLPEAGTLMIAGMTIAQAETAIQKALDTQFQGEHVEISLGRLRSVRVYVVGDVQRPGAYDVSSLSTPLSALYAAGGPTSRGSLRILRQYRGKQLVREFDLYDFLLRGVRSNDERLQPGDTVLVPPTGPQVSVEGMVRRPAIYELNGEKGLNQVLDLAGGLEASADVKQIRVERIEAQQSRTMFSLQLPDNPEEMDQKLAAFKPQDGDDVIISQIMPYNEQAVYLAGHVFHPGKYPYRDGMTLNDLLHSYQDVLPEPSDHAELIRLEAPDLRPEAISFNLHDVLIGNDSIPLRPFDLVRIYGRYELDAPNVVINGEVLRPGKYPMSEGMTAADLVRMAGGFRRSAFTNEADLSSYSVQDGQRVQINHTDVAIQKALDGDKNADVALKPGDVVSVRRLDGWQDIGATVTIRGEVEHAGSYGIQEGERLSAVLRRAGGFRADAYPYAAVMERVQVRELNEQARRELIDRVIETPVEVGPGAATTGESAEDVRRTLEAQRQQILTNLRSRRVNGRLVISISPDIDKWANTSADIEMRAGDTLVIPRRPEFVMASGQVYNPVAITYEPGKKLEWYLRKAGGATRSGNKRDIYVLRADGSVVPRESGWIGSDFMNLRMRPGDTIFVPEKVVGGSQAWQKLSATAETLTALMIPLALTGVF
jgi:protein involved in polysaccharide export with SLBB domain